jgi:hypothetical protein
MTGHVRGATVFFIVLSICSQAHAERLVLASASYGKNIVTICDAEGKVLWSHKTILLANPDWAFAVRACFSRTCDLFLAAGRRKVGEQL